MPSKFESNQISTDSPLKVEVVEDDELIRPTSPGKDRSNPNDSDSGSSATDSPDDDDEFNWSEDEDNSKPAHSESKVAKRGRYLWLGFLKLARPVRVFIIGLLGAAIFITPLLVVYFRFRETVIRNQVRVWSLWFTISWIAGCFTFIFVDSIPRIVVMLGHLVGGRVEKLKIQIEVMHTDTSSRLGTNGCVQLTMAVKTWLKLALDISWAWITLSVLRTVYNPFGTYWVIVNRFMQASNLSGLESTQFAYPQLLLRLCLPLASFYLWRNCFYNLSLSISTRKRWRNVCLRTSLD